MKSVLRKFLGAFLGAFLFTFLYFHLTGNVKASEPAANPKVMQTLENLAARLNAFDTLNADFTQTRRLAVSGGAAQTFESRGTLTLTHAGAFLWKQTEPFLQTVRLDGGTFSLQYEDDEPEVMTMDSHPAVFAVAELITNVVRLNTKALGNAFDFMLTGGETVGAPWTLVMTPKDETLKRMLGTVTLTGTNAVERLLMAPTAENTTDMVLTNVRTTPLK